MVRISYGNKTKLPKWMGLFTYFLHVVLFLPLTYLVTRIHALCNFIHERNQLTILNSFMFFHQIQSLKYDIIKNSINQICILFTIYQNIYSRDLANSFLRSKPGSLLSSWNIRKNGVGMYNNWIILHTKGEYWKKEINSIHFHSHPFYNMPRSGHKINP